MSGLYVLKYLVGLATTFLAIYGLTHDFKKEIKDEKDSVIKKHITKSGWINIIVLLFLSITTIIISIVEKRNSNIVSEKLDNLQEGRHVETQQKLESNLKQAKKIVENLTKYSESSLSNQEEFNRGIERSNLAIHDFEISTKKTLKDLNSSFNEFENSIYKAQRSISEFKKNYEDSKSIFDGVLLTGHVKINFEIPGHNAKFLANRIKNPNKMFTIEGKKYFEPYFVNYLRNQNSLEILQNLHYIVDSLDFNSCLRNISDWIAKKGISGINYFELQQKLNKLVLSKKEEEIYSALYLKSIIDHTMHCITDIDKWSVLIKINDNLSEKNKPNMYSGNSDFIFVDSYGLKVFGFHYKEYAEGFKLDNLYYTSEGVEFDIKFSFTKSFYENRVFRLNNLRNIEINFKTDFLDYGDLITGDIELNNSIGTKMTFTGINSIIYPNNNN